MGTTLTGLTPATTYDALIKVTDNGPLGGSLKTLTDGLGNDSALALSTGAASVTGTLAVSSGITSTGANTMLSASSSTEGLVVRGGSSIGTASTASGQILIGQTATYRGSIAYDDNAGYLYIDNLYNNNSGNIYFRTKTQGTAVEALTILGSGNVGIGISSPAQTLTVKGSIGIQRTSNTETSYINMEGELNVYAAPYNYSVIFHTGSGGVSSEKMRILPSGGITFNGDTAAANALDDYEEGTWTPSVTAASGAATYSTQFGSYTKIGRQVTVNWFVSFQKNTLSGFVSLSGFPFALANLSGYNYPQAAILIDNLASACDNPILQLNNGGTDANILLNNGSTTSHAAMDATQLGAGTMAFRGTATYFV